MSKSEKAINGKGVTNGLVEIKSKFDAEFRRISLKPEAIETYNEFEDIIRNLHSLNDTDFTISYTDPLHLDLLPINNDENLQYSLAVSKTIVRILVQRKGERLDYGSMSRSKRGSSLFSKQVPKPSLNIGIPQDFRRVSAIVDVDVIPETLRRVKLHKHMSDKPLGFYIRDGTAVRVTTQGLDKVPAIFISRLVPGGLAESTGLLDINDEVLEVNGIEVYGKTLDQVTDMMIANSANLIITVKPANQRNTLAARTKPPVNRFSTITSVDYCSDDEDEVIDVLKSNLPPECDL